MPSRPAGAAIGYRGDAARSGFVAGPDGDAPLQELWSRETSGPASYPVISAGRVVVTERVGLDSALIALDRRTGRPLWSKPLSRWWSGPLAYAGLIVVGNALGEVRAFDAVTGAPRWTTLLDDDPDDNAFFSTPIGADGKILLTGEDHLWALDAATGARRWKGLVDGTGSPSAADGTVFVSDTCHSTLAFAIADGARRWGGIGCGGGSEKTTAVHHGRVWSREERYQTSGDVLDAATGEVLDAYAVDEPPAFAGDLAVTLSSSALQAHDVETGVLRWEHRGPLLTAAPLIMGPNVYSATADGILHAFDLRTGALRWTDDLGSAVPESADHEERLHTGLGAGEGTLVVPTQDRLVAYAAIPPTTGPGPQSEPTAGAPAGRLAPPPVFPQTRPVVRSLRAEAADSVARLRRVLERRGLAAVRRRGGLVVGYPATRRYSITLEVRGRGRSRPLLARGTARAFRPGMLRIRVRARPALRRRGHLRAVTVTARLSTRAGARGAATRAVRVARRR
jgi:outer membrane protein assembly factor BamB